MFTTHRMWPVETCPVCVLCSYVMQHVGLLSFIIGYHWSTADAFVSSSYFATHVYMFTPFFFLSSCLCLQVSDLKARDWLFVEGGQISTGNVNAWHALRRWFVARTLLLVNVRREKGENAKMHSLSMYYGLNCEKRRENMHSGGLSTCQACFSVFFLIVLICPLVVVRLWGSLPY